MTTRRDDSNFFQSPQGAAVLKHQVLRSYLGVFTGKLGSTSGGVVHLIDGYAGPGRYDDGSPGSPALAIETARLMSRTRELRGSFIESDPDHHTALMELLRQEGLGEEWTVRQGLAEEHLTDLVAASGEAPLLVFLDPYGLTVPFDLLVEEVLDRPLPSPGPAGTSKRTTEVLMNFSVSAVRRMVGWATKSSLATDQERQTSATFGRRLDAFLGGPWWRQVHESEEENWMLRVIDEYCRRLAVTSRNPWTWFPIKVSDTYQGAAEYYLILLTLSPHGRWAFNDAASLGAERLRDWIDEQTGQLRMTEVTDGYFEAMIQTNIERALNTRSQGVRLGDHIEEIYGEAIGEARAKHVRAAVKRLYESDRLSEDPKGTDMRTYLARRPQGFGSDTP